jgi:hypothetical protein
MLITCDLCTGGPNCLNDCKIQAPGGCHAGDLRDDLGGKPYSDGSGGIVTEKLLENVMQDFYLKEEGK